MMYYMIVGVDIAYLCDLMTSLFGEVEKEQVFSGGQFDDAPSRKQRCEADAPEKEGEADGSSKNKVYPSQLPIPMELGVPAKDLP